VAIGKAALRLLASLRFNRSSTASAAGYAAVGIRCKQALKAACDAGAELSQKVRWLPMCPALLIAACLVASLDSLGQCPPTRLLYSTPPSQAHPQPASVSRPPPSLFHLAAGPG
jgi:hypothetical protein